MGTQKQIPSLKDVLETYPTVADQDEARRRHSDQARQELLSAGMSIGPDPILKGLIDGTGDDPRLNCAFIVRPSIEVQEFVARLQQTIAMNSSKLWLVPARNLHFTALETVVNGSTDQVASCLSAVRPHMHDFTELFRNPIRLVSPQLTLDRTAIAMTFVSEADGEQNFIAKRVQMHDLAVAHVIPVQSRYWSPSIHITIGRYIDRMSTEEVDSLVETVDRLNVEIADSRLAVAIGDSDVRFIYGKTWYGYATEIP